MSKIIIQLGCLVASLSALPMAMPSAVAGSVQEGTSVETQSPVARAAARYAASDWHAGPLAPGLALGELELPDHVGDALERDAGVVTRSFRSSGAETPAFLVEAVVLDSAQDAHEMLIGWLSGISSIDVARRMTALGDVGFAEPGQATSAARELVYFVRGNVAVSMSVLDRRETPDLDLLPLAMRIDAAIQATVEAGDVPLERVLRPEIRQLAIPAVAVGPAAVPLTVEALGPHGGECHLIWRVAGSGQGYVQQDLAGAWKFHPTGPGDVTLTLEATSRLGVHSERQVSLRVDAEQ